MGRLKFTNVVTIYTFNDPASVIHDAEQFTGRRLSEDEAIAVTVEQSKPGLAGLMYDVLTGIIGLAPDEFAVDVDVICEVDGEG